MGLYATFFSQDKYQKWYVERWSLPGVPHHLIFFTT